MPSRTKKDAPSEDAAMEDAPVSAQVEDVPDQDMPENGAAEEAEEEEEEEEEVEAQRVKILPGSTETAASFEFIEEGHTMGNALRYIIMKNPDVEFCAYTIPHPSEDKMNIRIQTYEGTAIDALKKGLGDLQQVCDVVADEFMTKRQQFNDENGIVR
ncbi:DNA-directed RNA polymerases I and III subunit RPAC2 [Beauveria bassiana]|uniref:DNA-directed RNA polymerases I and III subunit RPAC2 n=1 Tax=Beauveria bassiana (strain ARSEF 2860) TaxID=655819 RepID=J4W9D0_BEAB2|nr:DNA-directed RNA polymerases I and III subunit RPAC2 [Beauveria bassiana ARSEF 2860]EJP66780.1 DNA-directed RNA polymerases I and III subunit RPAC2 [Beauveria bassiana ARSEF 2860]KAF1732206.1 DNA-directed RNA polymerases I and III subunit RPAC2 [Beauveria bassiana]KAH8716478.1 DNA-directed RNA polymerases I and III subunit RPAC2 [Beauveria bassiana]